MKKLFVLALLVAGSIPAPQLKGQVFFTISMDGGQENPPVTTAAKGTGWAMLSADLTTLTYQITYARLQSAYTASHFHAGVRGTNGPVVRAIAFTGNTASGQWTNLPDTIVADLLRGKIYANIHTSGNPGGEIRGQLQPTQQGFSVSLDGVQEVPPVITGARGTGWVLWELDSLNSPRISYRVTIAGLSSNQTAAHFHAAPSGVAGPVVQPISFGGDSTASGIWTGVADSAITHLAKGNLYVNIHSTNFPGGEIRGQVNRTAEWVHYVDLSGSNEVPPVTTTGRGAGWAVLNTNMNSFKYQVTYARLQSSYTASHFHIAPPGVAGPVVRAITFTGNTASGEWTNLPDSVVRHILKGNVYMNIHTSGNPGGEIRGQLKGFVGAVGYSSNLDGSQEVPPTNTGARGTGVVVHYVPFSASVDTIYYLATIAGLSGSLTASHFHVGAPGVSGPVVHPISFSDSTASNQWLGFADSIITHLAKGNVYFNVHSSNFPGGEIRGQVRLGSGVVTGIQELSETVPQAFHLYQNYPNPFNPTTTIRFEVPHRSHIVLKLFNVLGQEVATLFDGFKESGSHLVQFNTHTLSSGVYFYRMFVEGGTPLTRKMIILK